MGSSIVLSGCCQVASVELNKSHGKLQHYNKYSIAWKVLIIINNNNNNLFF